jgi:peptide/nickel transport system substrate-binding protein
MTMWRAGVVTTGRRLAAGLLVATAITAAVQAQEAGNLTIAFRANQEPASLDGHIDPYQSAWLFNSFVADPLVVLDPNGKYLPALATSWEASPDGKVWTFKLRDGVKFQDGTPFNAEAVKYNFERILDPKTASVQLKSDVGPMKTIEVVDPLTVRVTYDTPWVTLLDALRRTPIWSPTTAEKHGLANFQRYLVGTGPFTLAEWVKNDRIVLKRWPDYGGWNPMSTHKGPAKLEQVTLRFIGEMAVLTQVVKQGSAQVGFNLPVQAIEEYKNDKNYKFISLPQSGTGLQLVMNIREKPLSDIKVRQALLYARDSKAINQLLYDGFYGMSDGPLDNVHPCFWPGASEMYKPSLEQARKLLDEAGWKTVQGKPIREAQGIAGVPDGTPLHIRYNTIHHKEIGEALQAQVRRAGIDLQVELVPGPVQIDRVRRRDFDLMFLRQRSPDPLILDQVWNSKWDQPGGWAWTGYKNEQLDQILNTLRSEPSFEKRCEAAKQAQKIIMDNALMLPTLTEPVFIALSAKVKDFQMGAEGNWFFLHSTSLER